MSQHVQVPPPVGGEYIADAAGTRFAIRERWALMNRKRSTQQQRRRAELERFEELEDAMAAAGALEAFQARETVSWEQVKAEMAGESRAVQD